MPRDVAQAIQADPLVDITGATGAKGYPSMCGVAPVLVPSVAHRQREAQDGLERQVAQALVAIGRLSRCDLALELQDAARLYQRVCLKAITHADDVCVATAKVERCLSWRPAVVVRQLAPALLCECFEVGCERYLVGNALGYFPNVAPAHHGIKVGVRHDCVANG